MSQWEPWVAMTWHLVTSKQSPQNTKSEKSASKTRLTMCQQTGQFLSSHFILDNSMVLVVDAAPGHSPPPRKEVSEKRKNRKSKNKTLPHQQTTSFLLMPRYILSLHNRYIEAKDMGKQPCTPKRQEPFGEFEWCDHCGHNISSRTEQQSWVWALNRFLIDTRSFCQEI